MKTIIKNKLQYYLNDNSIYISKYIAYHGSDNIIDNFKLLNPNMSGFYFSSDYENAKTYGIYVNKYELDIKNPLIINADGFKFTDEIPVRVLAKYPNEKPYYIEIKLDLDEIVYMVAHGKRKNSFIEIPNHKEYDAVIFKNIIDPQLSSRRNIPQDTIVVFDNNQIEKISDEYLKENENNFIIVYHGTKKKFVDDIYKNGLEDKSMNYQQGWYMVATDFESALFHAYAEENDFAYVFEFKIPVENNIRWLGFPYLWKGSVMNVNSTWYALKQPIPTEFITALHKIPYNKWMMQKLKGF